MAELAHPSEPSRFALALVALAVAIGVALFVMVSLGQETLLVAIFVGIVVLVLVIWATIQIWRIRLLGDAVLVSAETLPEVQAVLDVIRERLDYRRRLDVFVVDKISQVLSADAAPITLTTFFGVHVLVAEGDALGDLEAEKSREQLLFALATYVGALKARYERWWSPIITAFQMTGLTVFVLPFVYPYRRATVYSGDRIAYACCGDLDVSLQAVYRALVGKDLAKHLRADGLVGQALAARRRLLLRFSQLLRPTPHATNRYLQLLAFVWQRTPEAFAAHGPSVTGAQAERVLGRLGRGRAHGFAVAIGVGLALLALAGGLTAGVEFRQSPVAQGIANLFQAATSEDTSSSSAPETSPASETPPTPTDTQRALLALLPAGLQGSCAPGGGNASSRLVDSITCHPTGNQPDEIDLYAYQTPAAMDSAVRSLADGLATGDCATGPSAGTWSYQGVTQGPLVCYRSTAGRSTVVWGSEGNGVLVLASDAAWSLPTLYEWWRTDAPFLQ